MSEKAMSDMRKVIRWLGFDPFTGKWGIQVFIFLLVLILLMTNSVLFVVYKWDDVGKRLEGVKGIVSCLSCVAYITGLTSHWDETMLLVKTIENGLYKSSYPNTVKNEELKRTVENDMEKLRRTWNYMLIGYTACVYLAPALIFIFRVIQDSTGSIRVETLYTTLPFYYPENYDTITVYIVVCLLQGHLYSFGTMKGYVVLVSAFNSMQMIAGELKVLRKSLEEIGPTMERDKAVFKDGSKNNGTKNLKDFLKAFVNHHYHIHSTVEKVTKGMQLIAFSINSGLSVLLCTSVYNMARTNDIMTMTNEVMYSSVLIFCLYCYGLMGERISTEDKKLRIALYSFTWVNKPYWFKRSLLIIMTRTTRKIEMKSPGLFTLNLRNYILKLRAAYSYFNVLSSLR